MVLSVAARETRKLSMIRAISIAASPGTTRVLPSAGSGFHGPCLTRSMTLRSLQKGNISIEGRRIFPHSLGIFYQALSQYLGFPHYEQGDGPRGFGLVPGADGVGPARARQHGRSRAILGAVI